MVSVVELLFQHLLGPILRMAIAKTILVAKKEENFAERKEIFGAGRCAIV
jgi:hypothetical protein